MSKPKSNMPKVPSPIVTAIRRITYVILPIAGAAIIAATAVMGREFDPLLVGGLLCAGILLDLAFVVLKIALYIVVTTFLMAWLICSRFVTFAGSLFTKGDN